MAARKVIKKVAKTDTTTVKVGRPKQKIPTVTVLGIEFEQGSNYEFGKCTQKHNPGRVLTFIKDDGAYIMWGRHQQDRLMDVFRCDTEAQFTQQYNVVDFDTPTVVGAPQAEMPPYGGAVGAGYI